MLSQSCVTVVQNKIAIADMRILIQVVNTVFVEQRSTALDAMHDVAFFQQKFGQVSAVLSCHTSD